MSELESNVEITDAAPPSRRDPTALPYQTVFDAVADAAILIDTETLEHLDCNDAATALYGYEREELLKINCHQLSAEVEVTEALIRAGEPGKIFRIPLRYHRRKDGSTFPLEISARFFELNDRKVVLSTARDITHRKAAVEAMIKASRMEATAMLAGGIAHDFNNLMVGVMGNAELLETHVPKNDEVRDLLQGIKESAHRAGDLAQQLLAYARGGKYQPRVMDVGDLIWKTIQVLRDSASPQVRLSAEIHENLLSLHADASQIAQVLTNIGMNAIEAVGDQGHIHFEACNEPSSEPWLRISISDDGCGINEEIRPHLFEPYFSTKAEGRGLGLAAAFGIVENHGGRIEFDSEPGGQTTFHLILPATATLPTAESVSRLVLPGHHETILLIDDEPVVVEVGAQMLERLGYTVLTAINGEEALRLVKQHDGPIHLAMLDLGMPVMGGLEAGPMLLAVRPDMRLLICSGYELDTETQAAMETGAKGFLQKPFLLSELSMKIRQVLDAD